MSVRTRELNTEKGKLADSRAFFEIGKIGLVKVDLKLQFVELVEQTTWHGALELDGREGSGADGSDCEADQLLAEKLIVSSSSRIRTGARTTIPTGFLLAIASEVRLPRQELQNP